MCGSTISPRSVKTLLSTTPEREIRPVWSNTGEEVAFSSNRAGKWDIFLRPADGGGEEEVLLATPLHKFPADWSRDGKYLLYERVDPETGADIWYLERNEEGSVWVPRPFLQTPFNEEYARFSPNGRYVAYTSDESGHLEVYVQPFPEGGRRKTSFSAGSPSALFEHPSLKQANWDYQYNVSADGQRFVLAEPVGEAPKPSIRVVQNWYEEFRDRVQD